MYRVTIRQYYRLTQQEKYFAKVLASITIVRYSYTIETKHTEEYKMFTLMTLETESSNPEYREMTMEQAYKLASRGGFYKAQIISEAGVVEYEFH